ncbi:NPL4 family-domain-containing protein [Dimargaris cristalligena]|uniref:Nuclear protein localization protein 4 n=1 Tax=Dimargaris cristalligena TaxID=215637 RepID=A0A4P9ZP26_9FUNG|nr:NPL4 family-domain-containing protein [Dimargaris cristalligena]|eukprot:RKP34965.1 NPL4 family-domain-containing protein [Dimargaris cristalligena]
MCDYCMPIEPFDPNYLAEHAIKYLSFHSYLRQQTASSRVATTKGSSNSAGKANSKAAAAPGGMGVTVSTHPPRGADQMRDGKRIIPPPLEEPSYRVKVPCPAGHPSWPASICTKCQPGTITLQRQTFRMVDHVCFAHSDLVDRFIQYWRQTGTQRFGYLYGRYEPYTKVPLGIQAVVEAIYEPPQETAGDGLKVDMEWPGLARIDELARSCDGPGGLQLVGMIFTDLVDDGKGTGQVVCKRHLDTYFLSSLECIFSAEMQRRHPNPCKWSTSGHFGSKFVTVVVSGNAERNIDLAAYQMSTTAMALSEADVVEPTYDPSLVRVKPAEAHQRYVPDIMYKYKNEYNTVVSKNAKPVFPVEYLITTLTHGFPDQPAPRFLYCPNQFVDRH